MIDLDELLFGNPSWDEIVEMFRDGEFSEEHYLVDAIKRHLLTDDQCDQLCSARISIEDMLNGRISGDNKLVETIFINWNEQLGFECFAY